MDGSCPQIVSCAFFGCSVEQKHETNTCQYPMAVKCTRGFFGTDPFLRILSESVGESERTKPKATNRLWMDKIRSHHFETMGNHCLLVFTGNQTIPGFLRWCRNSSIHGMEYKGPLRLSQGTKPKFTKTYGPPLTLCKWPPTVGSGRRKLATPERGSSAGASKANSFPVTYLVTIGVRKRDRDSVSRQRRKTKKKRFKRKPAVPLPLRSGFSQ